MLMILNRYCYSDAHTLGMLHFAGPESDVPSRIFHTIERPWIPADYLGGKRFESCVPDGEYRLLPHQRDDNQFTYALENRGCGVFLEDQGDCRFAILMHPGNYVRDVVGCIAVGLGRGCDPSGAFVTSSRTAFMELYNAAPPIVEHDLLIRNNTGAVD